ncbi:5'-methylthioadenosine nucleosidase/S-adenosylhomocysteine nucleosidase [Desulfamplus magnetovallimortis]|uniref:Futalosine hydrolase n=1 Tax=Desulfamplus magnetovallimortis TaxID=1246637 RepID=A0A1W1H7E0_9BACT|nr:futalosine hydrolase [Desulfamplus magnetovallimortis]SLM28392.1 5'-methylthioadenosine nucleosidase/S-adenosylhomocysteine nucleosidase [Desulfamplus magnetovallimortis]
MRVLLVAATEMEIMPLIEQGIYQHTNVTVIITGVGVINTAHSLTKAIEAQKTDIIIQAGIGGAFESAGIDVGDIAVAKSDRYIHTGVEHHDFRLSSNIHGHTPRPGEFYNSPLPFPHTGGYDNSPLSFTQHVGYPNDPLPFDLVKDQPESREGLFFLDSDLTGKSKYIIKNNLSKKSLRYKIISGDFLTVSTITATSRTKDALIQAFLPCMESMEGAAAAHVASLYNIPFIEIRAASNLVGIRNKSDWNIPLAVERVCLALNALLP